LTNEVAENKAFTCGECGAELVLSRTRRTAACPFCKSPSVHEAEGDRERPTPALVLPFVAPEGAARAAVRAWTKRLRFFRESLSDATIEGLEAVYLPAYLYSAATRSTYSVRIGEHYSDTETETVLENGRSVERTRTVTRTEHRPLSGHFVSYVADVFASASTGLPTHELAHIEPFDMRLLRRYDASLISGWNAEHTTLGRSHCMEQARARAVARVGELLGSHMPGESHTDLTYSTQVERETLDLVLVPVWVVVVRPNLERPALRILANGQTLQVWGPERWSVVKIAAAVVVALIVAAILYAKAGE
jgi:hypothetical protein